jgi:hypothetical protein
MRRAGAAPRLATRPLVGTAARLATRPRATAAPPFPRVSPPERRA